MLSKCRICLTWEQRNPKEPLCKACGNRNRRNFWWQLPLIEEESQ